MISFSIVDHPAEAEVTAVEGDNEVFFDALAGAAGYQAADLLQRLADFHGEEIIVHQAADRFAREQIGGKRFEQCVRQRVAMDDAAGLALFVEHGERIEVGPAAEGFQYRRGGRIAWHGGLVVEQGAEVAAFVIQRDGAAIVFGH